MSPEKGNVTEVFRSIQGEGLHVGRQQIFMRMGGCSLRCSYCDTASSREWSDLCVLNGMAGEVSVPNPVDAEEIASFVRQLAGSSPGIHSLSVTGGEPLEQPDFLVSFLSRFRDTGLPVYLETNGTIPRSAREIAPLADIVSMDIKLPSLCEGLDSLGVYEETIPIFLGSSLFCKIVLARGFDRGEFLEAARLMATVDRDLPLVIQPATPSGGCLPPEGKVLIESYEKASGFLSDVRVIPQCHHLLALP